MAKRNQYAFDKKAYDHIHVQVAKGKKSIIQNRANENWNGSINAYINDLLRRDIGIDETEWKQREIDSENEE